MKPEESSRRGGSRRNLLLLGGALVLVAAGAVLLLTPYFVNPVEASLEAARRGDPARTAELADVARLRLDDSLLSSLLAPAAGGRLAGVRLWLLYDEGRYDELMEEAANAPAAARPHFWRASAQFQKGVRSDDPEVTLVWLRQSEEQFLESLKQFPEDWNTKFNYELVSRLVKSLEDPQSPPPVRVLRPEAKQGKRPPERKG